MPLTKPSSSTKHGQGSTHPNTSNPSKTNPVEIPKVSGPATSSLTGSSAEKPSPGAVLGDSMQRWLDQGPNEEPWYHGARLAGGTTTDGNGESKK